MQEIKRYTKEEVRAASLDYFKRSPLFVSGMTDDDYLLPANVFANKYAERDRAGNYTELTPDDMHRRLARKFAEAEAKSANPMSEDEIFLLLQFFGPVVPQGSPMMAIGNRFQLVSTSNCKVLPAPQDTMSAIFGIGRDMANLYKRRAGVGTDLSLLRPAGAAVNNAAITSTGAYSFGEFYSNITRMVGQNGRRGALMLTMDVRHPDIEQFITMKADLTKVTGANVSVKMTDEFMRAVEADEEYTLRWPVDARVKDAKTTKVVRAKEVFKLIAEMACNNAEPGLLFWNTIELNLPLNYYAGFEVISTNPCVTGDTQILTVAGPKSFAELAEKGEDVLVYAVNKETNAPVVRWMRSPRKTRENVEMLEIEFDSGLKVRATPDHNFIDFYGKKVQAKDLKPGSSVGAFTLTKHRDGHLAVARGVRGTANDTYYEYAHRLVAEAIGWDVEGKVVHHLNENPEDNRPENLSALLSHAEHNAIHYPQRRENGFNGSYARTLEIREKISTGLREFNASRRAQYADVENHKVVAVRPAGWADVYNGTVDEVHTYVIVDPEPNRITAKYTGIISANCGEIPLCAHDSCRLISIYLPHFVKRKFSRDAYFDFNEFHDVVTKAMRLSDDLVEIEIEHLSALRDKADTADERELFAKFVEKCQQGRRTGLGTHGLADALAQLRVRYDSEDGVGAAEAIYNRFKLSAYAASVVLAKERGPFPMFDWETEKECAFIQRLPQWLQNEIQKYGRRNGSLLTNAPTGSTSIESGNCSSGIEPVFANWYYRNMKIDAARETTTPDHTDAMGDGWKRFKVYHPNILRYLKLAHAQPLKYDLPQPEQADLPWEQFVEEAELPEYFVTANDIDYMKRVEMQGAIQQHIDHSISSTINLPKETKPEAVEAIYLEAWKRGLKGVTVYRDGSRESQVLSTGAAEKPKPEKDAEEEGTPKSFCAWCGLSWCCGSNKPESCEGWKRLNPEKEIPYWPYCPDCKEPMDFDKEEPLAYCACGPTEWGYPRPASWVPNPTKLAEATCPEPCVTTPSRGVATEGKMTKATFHDVNGRERKVYVYVGLNEDEQPVEVFITDERGDEELKPYAAALGKMTSLGLKHGVPAAAITKTLGGLKGGSVSYGEKTYESVPDFVSKLLAKVTEQTTANARLAMMSQMLPNSGEGKTILWEGSDVPDVYSSVADEMKKTVTGHDGVLSVSGRDIKISPALSAAYSVKLADVPATTTPTTTAITGAVGKPVVDVPRQGEKCQECEQWAVFKVDGCPTCKNCGWGRCG